MRAVIYARYSSDNQREASIEDQVRICRERIEREGWTLTEIYSDASISGATTLRPGYQMLLEHARNGAFDFVIAEALDRLSRDLEDIAGLFKQTQLLQRHAPDDCRGRDHGSPCRSQGHHERALPQGPGG